MIMMTVVTFYAFLCASVLSLGGTIEKDDDTTKSACLTSKRSRSSNLHYVVQQVVGIAPI